MDTMIDLHSHLLPAIDDGAPDMQAALRLARHAVASGTTHILFTPHIHPGRYENDIRSIEAAHAGLRSELEREGIPLKSAVAAEVRISIEMLGMLRQTLIPFLGDWEGQQVLLLEFPHSHILPGSDKLVRRLLDDGIRPMIAHPERNKEVLRDLDRLQPFIDMGCLVQVTAGSMAGDFGEPAQVRARQMLERGWITVLASDAHNEFRLPDLRSGRLAAAQVVGEAQSWQLVRDNPAKIVACRFPDLQDLG